MEFRSIASLEELETLPDNAQILIIDNNTAKRISKTNAHFGGGGAGAMVVTFTLALDSTEISADKTVEEVTAAMASMPVIGNLIIPTGETSVTVHLGACCSEIYTSETPTPAFGPFLFNSEKSAIVGVVGVNSSGQWEARIGA